MISKRRARQPSTTPRRLSAALRARDAPRLATAQRTRAFPTRPGAPAGPSRAAVRALRARGPAGTCPMIPGACLLPSRPVRASRAGPGAGQGLPRSPKRRSAAAPEGAAQPAGPDPVRGPARQYCSFKSRPAGRHPPTFQHDTPRRGTPPTDPTPALPRGGPGRDSGPRPSV